jgi:hypothetical protein
MPNVPENILQPQFWVRVRPSDEWLKTHEQANVDMGNEPIPDDQLVVQLVCDIEWIRTSALSKPEDWPSQRIEIGTLKTMTMAEFKRMGINQLAQARAAINAAKEQLQPS